MAFIPEAMAADALRSREIVRIPLRQNIPERNICMVYDSHHPLNAAAKQLKRTILEGTNNIDDQ